MYYEGEIEIGENSEGKSELDKDDVRISGYGGLNASRAMLGRFHDELIGDYGMMHLENGDIFLGRIRQEVSENNVAVGKEVIGIAIPPGGKPKLVADGKEPPRDCQPLKHDGVLLACSYKVNRDRSLD